MGDTRPDELPEGSYRCVCGANVPLSPPLICPDCGRHYDVGAVLTATAETIVFADGNAEPTSATDAEPDDELIGRRLGHFLPLSRLGGGGLGVVYRALDESLQRYVALKVLRGSQQEGVDVASLFREARAQARVNHPHVAHVYYVGETEELPYLAMELVGEDTLADRVQGSPPPFRLLVRYATQITEALEAAAGFGIVHGDVKPANVLVVDEETVKLSDFGLASQMTELDEHRVVGGTPDYMAPEVTRGEPADHRSDMYSLGVALFQMSFGRLPYAPQSTNVFERLRVHREEAVEFPETWPTELPLDWRTLLERLLAKDPNDRYADFAELRAELRRLQPIALPSASPLLRGFAWLFDGFLVGAPLAISALISESRPFGWVLGVPASVLIVAGIASLQGWWGTTPGKRLFQIRIVDEHGLRPSRTILLLRTFFQFPWASAAVFERVFAAPAVAGIGSLASIVAILFVLVEMGCVLFAARGSIHDRLLRTRVTLDTTPTDDATGR